jgi:hypothetical protein
MIESERHLPCEPNDLAKGQRPFPAKPVPQRLTIHVRHDVVETRPTIREAEGSRVEERQNVRVLQGGRGLYFPPESLWTEEEADVGSENLDGDSSTVSHVPRQVYHRHSAATDLAFHHVTIG